MSACKRCGVYEYDAALAETVRGYIAHLSEDMRTGEAEYTERLRFCRACGHMANGMCALCGCFIEVRAAKRHNRCAKSAGVW